MRQTSSESQWVLYVLLYDHLFGMGIRGGGAMKRQVMDNKVWCAMHSPLLVHNHYVNASDLVALSS
jgi:hypothetical protein